jgi:hypothetical protein
VQTDRTISNNKPDVRIHGNENGIKGAILGGRNESKKEAEKIIKYKDLAIER